MTEVDLIDFLYIVAAVGWDKALKKAKELEA